MFNANSKELIICYCYFIPLCHFMNSVLYLSCPISPLQGRPAHLLLLLLLLPPVGAGVPQGEQRGAGPRHHRGHDHGGVGLQSVLLVPVQRVHHQAAAVLAVPVGGVQQLAYLGGARGLVHHQLVVLAHQQAAGEEGVQALVQARLRHVLHDLLTARRHPAAHGALLRARRRWLENQGWVWSPWGWERGHSVNEIQSI